MEQAECPKGLFAACDFMIAASWAPGGPAVSLPAKKTCTGPLIVRALQNQFDEKSLHKYIETWQTELLQ